MHVRCTLVRVGGSTILVDTGVGHILSPTWFGATGRVLDELRAAGVEPDVIETVVLTHMHDDHVGGTVMTPGAITFPKARHVMHGADIEWLREWAKRDEEVRVVFDSFLAPLEQAGLLMPAEDGQPLAEGVRLRHLPGHTPGHSGVEVRSGGDRLVISGDAFNHPFQFGHPEWFGRSDGEPERAGATRRTLLEECSGSSVLIAPSHFADPFGRARTGEDGRAEWTAL